jgi:hypothetical protein
VLLFKHRSRKNHAFSALLDSSSKKQRAQMLLDSSRTDFELCANFFVAAAFNQQQQNLAIAAGNFDLVEVDHVRSCATRLIPAVRIVKKHVFRQSFAVAHEWINP